MYIFVKAVIEYTKNGMALIVDDKVIDGGSLDNYPSHIVKKILKEKPKTAYIKYARASNGFYDKDDNWHWNILAPLVDRDGEFIVKFHKTSYTRNELLDIISDFEVDGGKITNPIELLNKIFEELRYPSYTKDD